MTNKEYWAKRTLERLLVSEKLTSSVMPSILDLYTNSLNLILEEIEQLYSNYAKKGVLSVSDLKRVLTPKEYKKFLRKLKRTVEKLGLTLDEVYDTRYLSRLTRLKALETQVKAHIASIAQDEVKISQSLYAKIIKDNYKVMGQDFKLLGVQSNFIQLNDRVVSEIMRSKWVGGNYSSRIWANTDELAKELPKIIGGGLNSGQSNTKIAQLVRERFNVAKSNAMRLARTETNYMQNQSELQSYIDNGYDKYLYDAHIDSRTSSICRKLENKTFLTKDAQVGVNYPPMHPNCRSVTQVILSSRLDNVDKADRTGRLNLGKNNNQLETDNLQSLISPV